MPTRQKAVSFQISRGLSLICASSLCAVLVACGGTPVTPADYSRAEAQIREADEVDASTLAGEDLYAARTKLASARDAERAGQGDEALRLLREAEVHAELAETRAMAKTRQASLDEVKRGLDTLRRELEQPR